MKIKVCISAEKIPDFSSWSIMRWTSYFGSHCLLASDKEIFEAANKGVVRAPLAPFLVDHWIVDQIELNAPCTEEEFQEWFRQYEGKVPYGLTQWYGFVLPKWTRFLYSNGRKQAICTEFVCWFLTDIMGFDLEDEEFQTPQQIMDFIRSKIGGQ